VAPVSAGQLVAADTVLLRIDPVNYRLALAEAKAMLSTANMALADARALKRQAAIGEAELNIAAARERIVKAEQDLAYTEIKAPFDAVIDQQLVEYGQLSPPAGGGAIEQRSGRSAPAADAGGGGAPASSSGASVAQRADGRAKQRWQARMARIERASNNNRA
jgi:multidrug resistance efflux pump